jgi:hypothetical protein
MIVPSASRHCISNALPLTSPFYWRSSYLPPHGQFGLFVLKRRLHWHNVFLLVLVPRSFDSRGSTGQLAQICLPLPTHSLGFLLGALVLFRDRRWSHQRWQRITRLPRWVCKDRKLPVKKWVLTKISSSIGPRTKGWEAQVHNQISWINNRLSKTTDERRSHCF